MRNNIPQRITIDGEIQDLDLPSKWLTDKAGRKVTITVPQKGEQLKLVQMCKKCKKKSCLKTGRLSKSEQALSELANVLGLAELQGI